MLQTSAVMRHHSTRQLRSAQPAAQAAPCSRCCRHWRQAGLWARHAATLQASPQYRATPQPPHRFPLAGASRLAQRGLAQLARAASARSRCSASSGEGAASADGALTSGQRSAACASSTASCGMVAAAAAGLSAGDAPSTATSRDSSSRVSVCTAGGTAKGRQGAHQLQLRESLLRQSITQKSGSTGQALWLRGCHIPRPRCPAALQLASPARAARQGWRPAAAPPLGTAVPHAAGPSRRRTQKSARPPATAGCGGGRLG